MLRPASATFPFSSQERFPCVLWGTGGLTGTLLEPLTGAILAAFVLGQRLSAAGIAGAITLLAVVLVTIRGATPECGPGR